MDKKIFSGLENMGFDNIEDIKIYNKETETMKEKKEEKQEKSLLYSKEVTCPVCEPCIQSYRSKILSL